MVNFLWNYLRGYVIIKATGFSLERFINMAVYRGADLRSLRRVDDGVEFRASIADFKKLLVLAKKTKTRLRIRKRRGLPFFLNRYRRRKILFIGPVVFVAALYFLSSFVWLVEVNGSKRVSADEIAEFLESRGLKAGAFKHTVDERALEAAVLARFNDVAWVTVDLKGTKASVTLTEILPTPVVFDQSLPVDVVAAADGLIVSVETRAGTPKVKAGDVVKEGDVLVGGELLIGNEDTGITRRYTHAVSEVYAETIYKSEYDVALGYEEKTFTGRTFTERTINFFGFAVTPFKRKEPFAFYEIAREKKTLKLSDRYPLPFSYSADVYREYEVERKTRSEEAAAVIGRKHAYALIFAALDESAKLKYSEFTYERIDDFVRVTVFVTVVARIDKERVISQ